MPSTYSAMVESYIKRRRSTAAAAAKPNPGRVAVHRLNRAEYAAAIRDLLGMEIDARNLLSADEADQEGFDNIASVLSVSPLLLENYLSAARTISRLAVNDPTLNTVVETFKISKALVQGRTHERGPAVRLPGRHRPSATTSRWTASTASKCCCAARNTTTSSAWANRSRSISGWMASGVKRFKVGGEAKGQHGP